MVDAKVIQELISRIKSCDICASELEFGCRPVFSFNIDSKIVIIGQAPGSIVHRTGIPWDDKSGQNLRAWLDVTKDEFYNPSLFAIVPMGFCYPGKGKSGDLPPRKECAPQWHDPILSKLKNVELIVLIGKYAQDYYLKDKAHKTLTATVQNVDSYLPKYFVLPHPSPRNNIWMKKNPWFKEAVLPLLKQTIKTILQPLT